MTNFKYIHKPTFSATNSIVLLLIIVLYSSCSSSKLVRNYISNDNICFCGLDSTLLDDERQIDISSFNIDKIRAQHRDTIINTNDTQRIVRLPSVNELDITTFYRKTNIMTTNIYWLHNGKINMKISYFSNLVVGYSTSFDYYGKNEGEDNCNYIYKFVNIDTLSKVSTKYPICWKEALELLRAKIGKYEVVDMYREVNEKPNNIGMQYCWRINTHKKWRKDKYYYVDACTGVVKRGLKVTGVLNTDDQLYMP